MRTTARRNFQNTLATAALALVLGAPLAMAQTVPASQGLSAPTPLRKITPAPSAEAAPPAELETKQAIVSDRVLNASPKAGPPLGFPFSYPSQTSLADLVEKVSPAVVNIITTADNGETTTEGQGSGFIITPKGEVVTNYHVIDGGTLIEVEFNNGERYPAKIIGTDEETDLALLQIDSRRSFPTVKFHKGKKLRIGDWVVAIGNPFGIGQSTSFGIISAIGRERVESGSYVDYIQTDATINTGNSGGPLFNPMGDVIAVNSAIYSPTGASVGIGFSIPHYTAETIVRSLQTEGRVRRGWLGVGLRTAEYSTENKGLLNSGATINNVVSGSPAEIYGLQVDDIILNINGQTIRNSVEATRTIGSLRPNQKMNVTYERDEKPYRLTVMIGERPDKKAVDESVAGATAEIATEIPLSGPPTGMSLVDLSADARSALGMRYDQIGIYVESVLPGSVAANAGIKSNSVIMQFDSRDIPSVPAFEHMMGTAQAEGANSVILLVRQPNGGETMVVLPFN